MFNTGLFYSPPMSCIPYKSVITGPISDSRNKQFSCCKTAHIGSGVTAVAEPIDVIRILKLSVEEMDRFPMTDDGFKLSVLVRG
jgi:hypothetical protein